MQATYVNAMKRNQLASYLRFSRPEIFEVNSDSLRSTAQSVGLVNRTLNKVHVDVPYLTSVLNHDS